MSTDGDRLAPVTWLFGAPEPQTEHHEIASPPVALTEAALTEAAQLPPHEAPERPEPGRFEPINNVSMHALARRGMSTQEMVDYLRGREFSADEVELECERLLGVGLLDDAALAQNLVRTLRDRKGLGRQGLVAELRRRKLDSNAMSVALDEPDTDDELQRAIELAEKRAPQLRSYDHETARRRLSAFLMRKGYSGSVVSTAVARALQPTGGPVFR